MTNDTPTPEPVSGAAFGFTPRRIAIQLVGFAVGIALLVWCIRGAAAGDGIAHLRAAPPMLIALMLLCSAASGLINALTFWIAIRPVQRLSFFDLTLINFGAKLLNYTPVRLGAIGRVWFHYRMDGMPLLLIGGWFAFIAYVLVLSVMSCIIATAVHREIDVLWFAMVIGQMLLGGLTIWFFKDNAILQRHGQGLHRMVSSPTTLGVTLLLRILDLGAYALRLGLAAHILGLELTQANVIILAIVALASDLSPIGRVGIREFCVAQAAVMLQMQEGTLSADMANLALLDSAAEAIVFVGFGLPALLLLKMRVRRRMEKPSPSGGSSV